VRLATWNVNSIRARQERLLAFLVRWRPDVVCLQELKVQDEDFPAAALAAAGYGAVRLCQRAYNGVAILSREPASGVVRGLGDEVDDPQARLIAASVCGVRVLSAYAPNGGEVGSEKWAYKIDWLRRLAAYLAAQHRAEEPLVLCGDLNIAPEARDVCDPDLWEGSVLYHADLRAAFGRLEAGGLTDVFRRHHAEKGLYSWWDYRMLAFPKNNGLRIDHVLASPVLAARSTACVIDRQERKGKQPSDHAPVVADFALP
jgi:exodeoxyribonuclease-3